MHIHDASQLLDAFSIVYIVPHRPSGLEDASLLQLISPGIIATHNAFTRITLYPRDAVELLLDAQSLAAARIAGRGFKILPIPIDLLPTALEMASPHITVVVTADAELEATAQAAIDQRPEPILHASVLDRPADRADIAAHCVNVARYWKSASETELLGIMLEKAMSGWTDPIERTQLDWCDNAHLTTLPNVTALRSVGFDLKPWDGKGFVALENGPYFEMIYQGVLAIDTLRQDATTENPSLHARAHTDLILTVPGVLREWRQLVRQLDLSVDSKYEKSLRSLFRQIIARDTYSFHIEAGGKGDIEGLMATPAAQAILGIHREEIAAYSSVLAVRAASSLVPVVRLPSAPNKAQKEWTDLARATHSVVPAPPHKLNRLALRLSRRLDTGFAPWVYQHIRTAERIKLVADVPLEWMEIDGMPLMLRADVSRIPVTPGNVMVQLMLQCAERAIPIDRFQDVLVIRSFEDSDPLKPLIKIAIDGMSSGSDQFPNVKIVDVSTKDELIRALNDFEGAIAIYDGHGAHTDQTGIGELVLTDERVDPWTLRGVARVPPVVILAACDTHPFDASHATSTSGFLASGAMTVLGTSVPVDGLETAIFVGRLLLRVGEYLPLLVESRPWGSFRWSEILPGLQRRQYVTELLRRLDKHSGTSISESQHVGISCRIGMAIDTDQPWIDMLIAEVAQLTETSPEEAGQLIVRHAGFVNALAFTQFGNPELIVGIGDEPTSTD